MYVCVRTRARVRPRLRRYGRYRHTYNDSLSASRTDSGHSLEPRNQINTLGPGPSPTVHALGGKSVSPTEANYCVSNALCVYGECLLGRKLPWKDLWARVTVAVQDFVFVRVCSFFLRVW